MSGVTSASFTTIGSSLMGHSAVACTNNNCRTALLAIAIHTSNGVSIEIIQFLESALGRLRYWIIQTSPSSNAQSLGYQCRRLARRSNDANPFESVVEPFAKVGLREQLSSIFRNGERTVSLSAKEFFGYMAHTTNMEGVWALHRYGLDGVYSCRSINNWLRYINKFSFRLSGDSREPEAEDSPADLFGEMVNSTITYEETTA